jgi:hypothetical protein
VFKLLQPAETTLMCARQLGKSTSVAGAAILRCGMIRGFTTLIVQPRADQITRFDHTILSPMLRGCALTAPIFDKGGMRNVASKQFPSGGFIHLDYAFLSPERIRGYSGVACLVLDEAADIEWSFVPVIQEVLSASRKYGFTIYSGTPKSTDGTIGRSWAASSQGEWVVPCGCGKENIGSVGHDLIGMIGKLGLVCAKCGASLDTRLGRYVHAFPARVAEHAGYHVSQAVHPLHCERASKWRALLRKMDGPACYSRLRFYNEVLGEPLDEASRLLAPDDIRRAAEGGLAGTEAAALANARRFAGYVMGVDWSGGGGTDSTTAVAVCGFSPATDSIECVMALKLPQGMPPEEEARRLFELFTRLGCLFVAHDYTGAGFVRETLLRQAGVPTDRIVPYTYVCSPLADIVRFHEAAAGSARFSYSLDKARSLAVLCTAIKSLGVRLPKSRDDMAADPVVADLLALVENPKELPRGSLLYLIDKRPGMSDDFAHALNYACTCVWYTRQAYPRLDTRPPPDEEELRMADPTMVDWSTPGARRATGL